MESESQNNYALYVEHRTLSDRRIQCLTGDAENARLENAGLENSGTRNVWNATCGIT